MSNEIMKANGQGLQLATLADYREFAVTVCKSGLAPRTLDTPEKIMVALQAGAEVGLPPMTSLRSIAVVNGMPSIYGDAGLALVRQSGLMEWIEETIEGKFTTDLSKVEGSVTAVCRVKRASDPNPTERTFCVAEARLAGLWQKPGPWRTHPQRMLKYRARAFCLRDVFPDALLGLHVYEELQGEAPLHVESTCTSEALLEDDNDGIRPEGQQLQPLQEREEATGQDGPGLHGQGDDKRQAGMGVGVGQENPGDDVPVVQREAETENGNAERPAGDAGQPGRDVLAEQAINQHDTLKDEFLYWCPDCEFGFDYDKKTTVKKVGNTQVSCCPKCKTTQIQAWEDHLAAILSIL